MKTRVALIVLAIVCVGLFIGLIVTNNNASTQHNKDVESLASANSNLQTTTADLIKQKDSNQALQNIVTDRKADIAKLSNDLAQASETLGQKELALKSAMEETAKRDAKIADLETTNENLEKRSTDLKDNITKLEVAIADTQKKLASSEGDKAFLEKELHRLMDEKAQLEQQFNDLAALKQRVRTLREELNVARRVEWMRQGVFATADQKGATRLLQQGAGAVTLTPAGTTGHDLNVEVRSDGGVQVIPPITNNPPSAPDSPAIK